MPLICQAFICVGALDALWQTNVLSFSCWHYMLLSQLGKYIPPLDCVLIHLLLHYFVTPAWFYCLYLFFIFLHVVFLCYSWGRSELSAQGHQAEKSANHQSPYVSHSLCHFLASLLSPFIGLILLRSFLLFFFFIYF